MNDFVDSLSSSDRHFHRDFDVTAALALKGDERREAIHRLVAMLERGDDPRAARCLGDLGTAATALRIAASTAQPTTRIEAALAHEKVAGPSELVLETARDVLREGTASAQQIAVSALATRASRDELRDLALQHESPSIRADAFAAWLGAPAPRNSPAHALSQRILAGPLPLATACGPELDALTAPGTPADLDTPPFPELRSKLLEGTLDATDLARVGDSERKLLVAWAAWQLGKREPRAPAMALRLGVPGAREALEEMRGAGEGPFFDAVGQALRGAAEG